MGFLLKITNGPMAGRSFELKPGLVIGRSGTDIPLDDAKVSGKHAKIEIGQGGEWLLSDLGSTNGLRVKGKKLNQIPLTNGLNVKIGNTSCLFNEISDDPPPPLNEETLPPVPAKTDDWSVYLSKFAERAQKRVTSSEKKLAPFDPILVLTIVRGPQAGTVWTLGYGPRDIGPAALEFHLFESSIPPIVCRISPKGRRAAFSTDYSEHVRLNGKATSADTLNAGDEISVKETIIVVSYKE
jgi:pSer/pThr/pTyr-binding forkhead associated (FHA) protein